MGRPEDPIGVSSPQRLAAVVRRMLRSILTRRSDPAADRRAIGRALRGQLSGHLTKDVGGED